MSRHDKTNARREIQANSSSPCLSTSVIPLADRFRSSIFHCRLLLIQPHRTQQGRCTGNNTRHTYPRRRHHPVHRFRNIRHLERHCQWRRLLHTQQTRWDSLCQGNMGCHRFPRFRIVRWTQPWSSGRPPTCNGNTVRPGSNIPRAHPAGKLSHQRPQRSS